MNSFRKRIVAITATVLAGPGYLLADDIDTATGVAGSNSDDTIVVTDPTTADANANEVVDSDSDVDQSDVADGEAEVDLSVSATATATGIDGDGGDDTIDNSATVDSSATSDSGGGAGVITATFDESTAMDASSSSTATATAIDGGSDSNVVNNDGDLTSTATAGSSAQSATSNVLDPNDPLANIQSDLNASSSAVAAAGGINAGDDRTSATTRATTRVGPTGLQISVSETTTTSSTNHTITNSGTIVSNATANSDSSTQAASLGASGSANANAEAAASANSFGILSGGGNDGIDNSASITTMSNAAAGATDLGLTAGQGQTSLPGSSPASNATQGAIANARSIGIDSDGQNHNVERDLTTTITASGLSSTASTLTFSNSGSDVITNTAEISATSIASSSGLAGSGSISSDGPSTLNAESGSSAYSAAVSTGGNSDTIDNQSALTVAATSDATSLAVNFSRGGSGSSAGADANVDSDAEAVGIAADGNDGDTLVTTSLTVDQDGVTLQLSDERFAHLGDDTVISDASIDVIADASGGAGAAPISFNGSASSDLTVDAGSRAAAIDLGGGSDSLTGSGAITATASSNSTAVGVGFNQNTGQELSTNSKIDTSSAARSDASGVSGDSGSDSLTSSTLTLGPGGVDFVYDRQSTATSGNDQIDFDGTIATNSSALSTGVSAAISISRSANSTMDSTAKSNASSIVAGGGDDVINSSGTFSATSTANAFGVSATVGERGTVGSNGTTNVSADMFAEAEANGIAGDGGSANTQTTVSLTIDDQGIRGSYLDSSTAASGDDRILSSAAITSNANANTGGAAFVSMTGPASSSLEASADALARGIDAGAGNDDVENSGNLTTTSSSVAAAIDASVSSQSGATSASGLLGGGTSASSDAIGLSTAGHDHVNSTTIDTIIDFDTGLFIDIEYLADGVSLDGDDTVINTGNLTTDSTATTVQATGGLAAAGMALSIGRTETNAHAGGIETGNGNDNISNSGNLTNNATSTAVALNVAVATTSGQGIAGNTAWDGGTTASSSAMGIDADSGVIDSTQISIEASTDRAQVVYDETTTRAAGNDFINNSGAIEAHALSVAPTLTVGSSASGIAATVSTSTAESVANGIRGGQGDDEIINSGNVNTSSDSVAVTANIAVTPSGAAVAADAVWDGGTSADATSIGIAGDGGDQVSTRRIAVGTDEISYDEDAVIADGADTIDNSGDVTVTADSTTVSVSGAVAVTGVGIATSTSNATANAAAIDAGAGSGIDDVGNSGVLTVNSTATAVSTSMSVSNGGLAVAADSVWDGGTTASSRARGIDVGAGGETVRNDGRIDATSNASAGSAAVSVAVTGFAAASATSTAQSDSIAIDASAGDDDDTIINTGELTTNSNATGVTAAATFSNVGVSIASGAVWDGGTGATANSRGIATGNGADTIGNTANINTNADATSVEASASIAVTGITGAVATSTAEANAISIDAGADDAIDSVVNDGDLTVNSNATAVAASVSLTTAGIAVAADTFWDGGTTADAVARGIQVGAGDDTVINNGDLTLTSNADSVAVTASATINGVAGGVSTASVNADARAISGATGNDRIENNGNLEILADSDATAVNVALVAGIGIAGASDAVWDGGTLASSIATGLDGGDGNDIIISAENVTNNVTADSTSTSVAVAMNIAGYGVALSNSTSRADANGIDAGAGDDIVVNDSDITSRANTDARAVAVSVQGLGSGVAGSPDWDGGTGSLATANGIVLGGGDDLATSSGVVTVTADADIDSNVVALQLAGINAGVADVNVEANAFGFAAGDGDDMAQNSGSVVVHAMSDATGRTIGGGIVGVSLSSAAAEAESNATGMSGDGGDDVLMNSGSITSTATATARARAINAQGGGYTLNDAGTDARSNSSGMRGGDGNDTLINEETASIVVNSNATTDSNSVAVTIVGAAQGNAQTLPIADSIGLAGDAGDDEVLNAGELLVDAQSTGTASGTSAAAIGFASARSGTEAQANATGIDGGIGADTLVNTGTIRIGQAPGVSADAYWMAQVTTSGVSGSGVGADTAESQSTALTRSTGIEGGTEDDVISNEGVIDVFATARNVASNSSLTLLGASSTGADAGAETVAAGLSGGSGDDTIMNSGDLGVLADSSISMSGTSYGFIGNSDSDGTMSARATAAGILGGDGNDQVLNDENGTLSVRAKADSRGSSTSTTFAGGSNNATVLSGSTDATGVRTGGGDDDIWNDGAVTVDSEVLLISTGGAKSTIQLGNTTTSGRVRTESEATGFDAGDGNDNLSIGSGGSLFVRSVAESESKNTASSGASLISSTTAGARAETLAVANGLEGGDGDNVFDNDGLVTVNARSNAYAFSRANGASVSLSGNAVSNARANAQARSTGVSAGDGDNVVMNSGNLTVTANASTAREVTVSFEILTLDGTNPVTTRRTLDDDLLPDPEDPGFTMDVGEYIFWTEAGNADCTDQNYACENDPELGDEGGAYYELVEVEVDDVDADDNPIVRIERRWVLTNVALATREEALGEFPTVATGNGHGVSGGGTGDARGTAAATATGIVLGDGDNMVLNESDIRVTADAFGAMRAVSSGTLAGDAISRAHATGNAYANGIIFGDGDNLLLNEGLLEVTALASTESRVSAAAGGGVCISFIFFTWCPVPEGTPTRDPEQNLQAEATAVNVGDGNNVLINDGEILVTANATHDSSGASATPNNPAFNPVIVVHATGIETGDGDNTIENNGELLVEAIASQNDTLSARGIVTGSGDDTVINNGLISAVTTVGSASTLGTAIDTGAGNDEIVLGAESETNGSIILGQGDDTLTISGTPILNLGGGLSGDEGSDTLQLVGPGSLATNLSSFEHAVKAGDGRFILSGIASLDSLTIDGGILELQSDYTFLDSGEYSTYFHSDGDSGRLVVDGAVTIDGALNVERRGDTFISDGSRYSVVVASGGINNAFTDVTLPEALPLLSFAMDQTANDIDIVASAASFSTVANTGLHTTLANNLFSIANDASGDFARDLGTIQLMESGFGRTFASLSPDTFQASTTSTLTMDYQSTQMLRTHLGNARAVARRQLESVAAYQPVTLAYLNGEIRTDGGTSGLLFADAGGPLPEDDAVLRDRLAAQARLTEPRLGQTWMSVYGANGDYDSDSGYTSIDQTADGFAIGIDYQLHDSVIAGFNFSRSNSNMDHTEAFAETNIDGWSAGLHATWFDSNTFIEGGYLISRQEFNNRRAVVIDTEDRVATAQHNGDGYMAFLGLGQQLEVGNWRIEPFATGYFINLNEHGFSENGAGSLNLLIEKRSNRALFMELGARFSFLQQLDNSVIDWHALLAFDRDFEIDEGEIRYAWAGAPDSIFTLEDRVLKHNSKVFGAGFTLIRDRSTISLDYRGQFNSDYRNQILSAKLSYAF